MDKRVLLDTSFFLRFLKENDPLFKNANDFYRELLNREYSLVISTVSIAEYCVRGSTDELPLKNLQILPFNYDHAIKAGEFASILFEARRNKLIKLEDRMIIPNDTKLFAQADVDLKIKYFVTSDSESIKSFEHLKQKIQLNFSIIDINTEKSDFFNSGQSQLNF